MGGSIRAREYYNRDMEPRDDNSGSALRVGMTGTSGDDTRPRVGTAERTAIAWMLTAGAASRVWRAGTNPDHRLAGRAPLGPRAVPKWAKVFFPLAVVLLSVAWMPSQARAKEADLSRCVGRWEGTAEDPWDPGPYVMQVDLTGGVRQCATVTYVDMCTSRWVECTAGPDWVSATETLVDPGPCASGTVEVRCDRSDALHVRWQGSEGIMETTLQRVRTAARQAATAEPIAGGNSAAPLPSSPSPPSAVASSCGGCRTGGSGALLCLVLLLWHRRR